MLVPVKSVSVRSVIGKGWKGAEAAQLWDTGRGVSCYGVAFPDADLALFSVGDRWIWVSHNATDFTGFAIDDLCHTGDTAAKVQAALETVAIMEGVTV